MSDFLERWRLKQKIVLEELDDIEDDTREESDTTSAKTDGEDRISKEDKRIYNNTYRNKNKTKINRARRLYEQTPTGAYNKSKRRARSKKQEWTISLTNWVNVWSSCPKVYDDSTGTYRLAWTMRGGDIQKNTQMRRKDVSKGWMVGNVEIVYRNQPIPAHGILAPWDWKRNKPGRLEL